MFNPEKFIETVQAVKTGNYSMGYEELDVMFEAAGADSVRLAGLAYRYGLLRGQRKEKNKSKRRKAA